MIIIFELILHIESSLSGGRKEKCKGKKISSERVRGIFLVAGVGFEPHGLAFSLRRKCCGRFDGSDKPPACHSLPSHPPSYSPFGLITRQVVSLKSYHSKTKARQTYGLPCFCLVAGVGFEPHDLRVMSPTSYRTALPRDIMAFGKLIPIRHYLLYHTFLPLSILFTDFLCDLLRQIILCAFLTYAFSFA